jgi:hypothetical protein
VSASISNTIFFTFLPPQTILFDILYTLVYHHTLKKSSSFAEFFSFFSPAGFADRQRDSGGAPGKDQAAQGQPQGESRRTAAFRRLGGQRGGGGFSGRGADRRFGGPIRWGAAAPVLPGPPG